MEILRVSACVISHLERLLDCPERPVADGIWHLIP
jgi:hypothetical protein